MSKALIVVHNPEYVEEVEMPRYPFSKVDRCPSLPSITIYESASFYLDHWDYEVQCPYWAMWWADRPGTHVVCNGQRQEVLPGRILLLTPYAIAKLRMANPVHHTYAHFIVAPPFHNPKERLHSILDDRWMAKVKRRITESLTAGLDEACTRIDLGALTSRLLQEIPAGDWSKSSIDSRIHKAMIYIESSLGEKLSNDRIAERVEMTGESFAIVFRKLTGQALHQYVIRRRCEVAATKLLNSDATIDQIAALCGFSDRFHFTRAFTARMKTSPASYRKLRLPRRITSTCSGAT